MIRFEVVPSRLHGTTLSPLTSALPRSPPMVQIYSVIFESHRAYKLKLRSPIEDILPNTKSESFVCVLPSLLLTCCCVSCPGSKVSWTFRDMTFLGERFVANSLPTSSSCSSAHSESRSSACCHSLKRARSKLSAVRTATHHGSPRNLRLTLKSVWGWGGANSVEVQFGQR